MIVICPGCSGVNYELIREIFKGEKIIYGCIGECGGRMDESSVAFVNGIFVEAKNEDELILKIKNILK